MAISFHVKSDCGAGLAFQSEMVSGSGADRKPLWARSPSVVSEATADERLVASSESVAVASDTTLGLLAQNNSRLLAPPFFDAVEDLHWMGLRPNFEGTQSANEVTGSVLSRYRGKIAEAPACIDRTRPERVLKFSPNFGRQSDII
jgi:hypothetical protein